MSLEEEEKEEEAAGGGEWDMANERWVRGVLRAIRRI